MNQRQKIALVIGLAAFGAWGAYPSWERPLSASPYAVEEYGHAWLWSGPGYTTTNCEAAVALGERRRLLVRHSAERYAAWSRGTPAPAVPDSELSQLPPLDTTDPTIRLMMRMPNRPSTPAQIMESAQFLCTLAESTLARTGLSIPTIRGSYDHTRVALRSLLIGWAVIGALTAAAVAALGLPPLKPSD